ncbi:MAG: pantetheine-phosphate adenylyltransferase, partial [Taibaiella sp.]|nr:pantetheine-phosphate adenylyltransferase [Taibaiella sp.]
MQKICLFPGTFDPITMGHVDVIQRSVSLFDKLIVAIGVNTSKTPMFSVEQRIAWIQEIFKDYPQIEVTSYTGLTINYCKEIGAQYMMRGIRYISDFEYEKAIGDMNRLLAPESQVRLATVLDALQAGATVAMPYELHIERSDEDRTCLEVH